MPLHVGLDLDGVVFSYVNNIREEVRAWQLAKGLEAPEIIHARLDDPTSLEIWKMYLRWGINDEEFLEINRIAAAEGRLYRGPIEPGWIEALTKLRDQGHSVHIVTARFEGAPGPTSEWLIEHEVPHDALTFAKDKSKLGLDLLIDDRHENIRDWVATGRPGILYSQPWNEHSNTGAIRAYNPEHVVAAVSYLDTQANLATGVKGSTDDPDPESILEEAQRLVHGDRGEDYGHPIHDFARTGRLWSPLLREWAILAADDEDLPVPPELVGLCMVGVKLSREINRPKRDNRVDGAGYFETVDMVHEFRRKAAAGEITESGR